jgi:transcriptional regulator with XRE-family HTH domain
MRDHQTTFDDADVPTDRDRLRGEYLRALRVQRGFEAQLDLERATGVRQAMISRYEQGHRMGRATAEKLGQALGVTPERLLGELDIGVEAPAEVGDDPLPNRRRLRELPEFQAMPPEVQRQVVDRNIDHDLGFFEWIDDLRMYLTLFQRGQLKNERGGVPVPLREDTADRLKRGLIPPPPARKRRR